jgi:hypothetical protein
MLKTSLLGWLFLLCIFSHCGLTVTHTSADECLRFLSLLKWKEKEERAGVCVTFLCLLHLTSCPGISAHDQIHPAQSCTWGRVRSQVWEGQRSMQRGLAVKPAVSRTSVGMAHKPRPWYTHCGNSSQETVQQRLWLHASFTKWVQREIFPWASLTISTHWALPGVKTWLHRKIRNFRVL